MRRTSLDVAGSALLFLLLPASLALMPSPAYMLVCAVLVSAAGFALDHLVRHWSRIRKFDLRVDERGLHDGVQCVVARDSIRAAFVHGDGPTSVRLTRWMRPVEVLVTDAVEGAALIHALRLAPSRCVARYSVREGTERQFLLRICILFAAFVALYVPSFWLSFRAGGFLLAGAACAAHVAALGVAVARLNPTALVGADGVRVQRRLGAPCFLRYADIFCVEFDGTTAVLRANDGRVLTLSTGRVGPGMDARRDELSDLVRRIAARIDAQATVDAPHVREVLARGERDTKDWVEALRAYSSDRATFRTPALPPDTLWAVVEDATAPATARLGAAVALQPALDDDGRGRLRVAAEACAEPRLRVALERAARGLDDAALAEAMDTLDDDADDARRHRSRA